MYSKCVQQKLDPEVRTVRELYDKMLHEADPAKQRAAMRRLEDYVLNDQAHEIWALWWHRIVPYRSYLKGFKIAPTHFINQDLATIWLDK